MITLVSSPWGLGPTLMHRTVTSLLLGAKTILVLPHNYSSALNFPAIWKCFHMKQWICWTSKMSFELYFEWEIFLFFVNLNLNTMADCSFALYVLYVFVRNTNTKDKIPSYQKYFQTHIFTEEKRMVSIPCRLNLNWIIAS